MKKIKTFPSLPSVKIGGMKNIDKRIPLYGSIRFCVTGKEEEMYTQTSSIVLDKGENIVTINGIEVDGKPKSRVEKVFYDLVERAGLSNMSFKLESKNVGYPTGGGLASSAAGLAASTLSLYESIKETHQEFYLDTKDISRVARMGSSSAVGSVSGSYSELVVTDDDAWGEKLGEKDSLGEIRILIAKIEGGEDSDTIHRAMENSRYRERRIEFVNDIIPRIKTALQEGDVSRFIEYTHQDTENYHGALLDQGLLTFGSSTVSIFKKVKHLQKEGSDVGLSIAGGPTPIILSSNDDFEYMKEQMEDVLQESEVVEVIIAGESEVVQNE